MEQGAINTQVDNKMRSWFTAARSWSTFGISLLVLLIGAIGQLNSMRQQIALLNQKIDLMMGDHEKRITELEATQKAQGENLTALITIHEPLYKEKKIGN